MYTDHQSKQRFLVGQATVATAGTTQFDLGAFAHRSHFVLTANHSDGTPAAVRILHSGVITDAAGATSAVACELGEYYFVPYLNSRNAIPRYLNIYGLSNGTIVTVSRLAP